MPPTETRAGDSRRDPVPLIVVAALLLALRIGVTMWEQAHSAESGDSAFPGASGPLNPGP